MDIALDADRPVPTLRLTGRFDGDGATAFDTFVERLDPAAEHWILDFTGVQYLSSMGLRALVKAEKRLRARHGALVLASVSRHVRHVLVMARLDTVLRIAPSVDAALRLVPSGSVAPERAARSLRDGRACAVWPLGGRSVLETWGRTAAHAPPTGSMRMPVDVDARQCGVCRWHRRAGRHAGAGERGDRSAARSAGVRGAADAWHAQRVGFRGARPPI